MWTDIRVAVATPAISWMKCLQLAWILLALSSLLLQVAQVPASAAEPVPTPEFLQDVLRAGAEAMKTIEADLKVSTQPGPEVSSVKEYYQVMASHVRKIAKDEQRAKELDRIAAAISYPTKTSLYRISGALPDRWRIECLDPPSVNPLESGLLTILVGDRCTTVGPAPPDRVGIKFYAGISKYRMPPMAPRPMVGMAMAATGDMLFRNVVEGAKKSFAGMTLSIPWEEAFERFSDARSELAALPGTGAVVPMLECRLPVDEKVGHSWARFRVWFNSADFMPKRFQLDWLMDEPAIAKYYLLPSQVVEWNQFLKADDVWVCTDAIVREYSIFRLPNGQVDSSTWPGESYETKLEHYTLDKVKLNDSFNYGLFDFEPAPGTNVIDEIEGVSYLVGSPGEEIRKISREITQRSPSPPSSTRRPMGWRWLTYGSLAVLLATGIALLHRRIRSLQ